MIEQPRVNERHDPHQTLRVTCLSSPHTVETRSGGSCRLKLVPFEAYLGEYTDRRVRPAAAELCRLFELDGATRVVDPDVDAGDLMIMAVDKDRF